MGQLDIMIKFVSLLFVSIGGVWVLSKYIIERGMIPAVELDIGCKYLGTKDQCKVIEVIVYVKNVGNAVLIPGNIRIRVKTDGGKPITLYDDERKKARMKFPDLIQKRCDKKTDRSKVVKNNILGNDKDVGFIPLLPDPKEDKKHGQKFNNTFVQPGVTQKYTFITAIEEDVIFIHTTAMFDYVVRFNPISLFMLKASKFFGLIQFSLNSINQPHSVERAFSIDTIQ